MIKDEKENIKALVAKAQAGDGDAFSELLKLYNPLISSVVARSTVDGMTDEDVEDLRQEANLAFYSSLVSYDPGISEVEFGLYAKVCVCNRLVSFVRSFKRRMQYSADVEDPDELLRDVEGGDDPASRVADIESEKSLRKLIDASLSDYENRVFEMYVSGMSALEMAKRLGSTEKSVSNAIYRIRKKLKEKIKK